MGIASTVRAGRAFVELFANNNALYRGLDQAKKHLQQWARSVTSIGLKMSVTGGAITAPLAKLLSDFAGRGNAIQQLADRLGSTTESVSRLAYGFEAAGGTLDGFAAAAEGIAGKLSRLQDQESFFGDELRGLSAGQLRGKGIDDQLDLIAEKFATIKDAQDQARVAGELGLTGLLKYIREGKAGLDKLRAAVPADGIIGGKEAKESAELVQAGNRAWMELRTTLWDVARALLPAADSTRTLSEQVAEVGARVRRWVKDNGGLIVSVAAAGAGLVAGGVAVGLFGKALSLTAMALGGVTVALKAAAGAVALLLSPVGLVTAAVAGLGAILLTQTETGREAVGTLGGLFTGLGETAKTAWGGIVAAVGSGDLKTAGEIAFLGLKTAWARVTAAMTDLWNKFKRTVLDGLRDITAGLGAAFSGDVVGGLLRGKGVLGAVAGSAADENGAVHRAAARRQEEFEAAEIERAKDLFAALVEAEYRAEALAARASAAAVREAVTAPGGPARETLPAPRLAQVQQQLRDQLPQLFAAARGGFGGPVQAQFGYGDTVARRQLDAAQDTAKNTAVLPAINQQVGQLNDALRFGR